MMSETERRDDAPGQGKTLFELMTTTVRRFSDGQLAMACASGIAGVALILLLRPGWWRFTLPLTCLGAFGAWGIAEREQGAHGVRRIIVTLVRTVAVVAAAGAAIATVLMAMTVALGTWIS